MVNRFAGKPVMRAIGRVSASMFAPPGNRRRKTRASAAGEGDREYLAGAHSGRKTKGKNEHKKHYR
ncbi:MAG: hypothetical protein ACKO38_10300, partial [Planctomycetota bacterium]